MKKGRRRCLHIEVAACTKDCQVRFMFCFFAGEGYMQYMCGTPFGERAERGPDRVRRPFFDAERGPLQY